MPSFGVVLDACVLIPAALRDTLLRAARQGLYRPYWSEAILEEVRRNLVENRLTDEHRAQRLVDTLRRAFPEATVQGLEPLIDSMTNDPDDRHVLAAAVAAGAPVIVTMNLRHFSDEALAPFGVEAQSPDMFLMHFFDIDTDLMTQVVARQAAALRSPPMTIADVLDNLARHAPTFAAEIRRQLAW
jgi:predicted nucleic acid-binding protein